MQRYNLTSLEILNVPIRIVIIHRFRLQRYKIFLKFPNIFWFFAHLFVPLQPEIGIYFLSVNGRWLSNRKIVKSKNREIVK